MERKYSVDRALQDVFCSKILDAANMDYHGIYCGKDKAHCNYREGYENDTFAIYPYWWGDEDNLDEIKKPNFLYKPTGLEIEWYKYPLRSAFMNQNLNRDQLILIFENCLESIEEDMKNNDED